MRTILRTTAYRRSGRHLACAIAVCCSASTLAQQDVPFQGGIPLAPSGLANKPLGDGPWTYATGEGMDIKVSVVARGLEYPYGMAFLPDGTLLVTQRTGQLRIIRNGALDPDPVAGGPEAVFRGESGLPGAVHGYMNIALHPRFSENRLLYLTYNKPTGQGGASEVNVARARFENDALHDVTDILTVTGGGGAAPLAFAQDGTLFIGAGGGDGQHPGTLGGKVLRINDDGSVPNDNPFARRAGYRPEIYTLGHRNVLGMAMHPPTGIMWVSENGPNGGDELNIVRPGANYGWPIVSLGRTYQGPWQASNRPTHEVFEPPAVYWMPAIAVSGMLFYTGDALPAWKGDVIVGALRTGQIPGTGHIERILFNQDMQELRRESLLVDLRQRVRDVAQGPDGFIYLTTDEVNGAVLRIEPGS